MKIERDIENINSIQKFKKPKINSTSKQKAKEKGSKL